MGKRRKSGARDRRPGASVTDLLLAVVIAALVGGVLAYLFELPTWLFLVIGFLVATGWTYWRGQK
jgi:hypothetical protein